MHLLLLRHGQAERVARSDRERSLTDDGRRQVQAAAAICARQGLELTRLLSSPYLRARQSAELLAAALGHGAIEEEACLAPEAEPSELLARLGRDGTIALVGHEPLLGRLLGLLLTGSRQAAIPLSTGMVVLVELDGHASLVGRLLLAHAPE